MLTNTLGTSSFSYSARVVLLLSAAVLAACGDTVVEDGGSGGSGEGGGATGQGGETASTGGTGGTVGTGGSAPCECDEGEVAIDACPSESLAPCEPKTCGAVTIGCIPVEPCNANACAGTTVADYGCATVGEECQTVGCHGDPAQLFLCTDDQIWTDSADLYFACGDETCDRGLEYCEDVSDAGNNQVFRCLPIPEGCSNDDFCACEAALEVCDDASCGTTGGDGNWIVSCW